MKLSLYSAVIVMVAIVPVFSETPVSNENEDSSNTYIGLKGGPMSISHGMPFSDDGILLGVLFGYDIPNNGFAIEGEFNTTVSKASSKNTNYSDLGVTTLAGYGVYRTSGRFYVKGKLGLLYEYLTSSVSGGGVVIDVDGPGLAISIGIGGGVHISERLSAEIEYTSIEADIGYASLGLNWHF